MPIVPMAGVFPLLLLAAVPATASAGAVPCPSALVASVVPPRIDRVHIVRHDIFDDTDGPLPWPYRLADRLHARTREDVIRRELLVGPGDCPDPEALAQTERNLRNTGFLRDARVEAGPAASGQPGAVDVSISTFDSWTTSPQLRLAKVGNRVVWTVGLAERNLLGRGQQVEIQRRSDLDRDQAFVSFRDPRVRGSRVALSALHADRSDGRRTEVALSRPFFSLDTAWSFGVRHESYDQLDPLYEAGERVGDLAHVSRRLDVEGGRSLRRTATGVWRLQAAHRRTRDEVDTDLRRFGTAEVGVHFVQHRYLRLTHLSRFERAEDVNLGHRLGLSLAVSAPVLGGQPGHVFFVAASETKGFDLGRGHFVLAEMEASARHRAGRWENASSRAEVTAAARLRPRAVVLTRAEYVHGSRLDPEAQVMVGAQNGLRGHPVNQFVGTRALLLGTEMRLFVADDVHQLASFALALFAETGYAWPEGDGVALRDLRGDVGIGVLIGRNRLTSRPARIDVAWAFDPAPGRSRFLVSFGARSGFLD